MVDYINTEDGGIEIAMPAALVLEDIGATTSCNDNSNTDTIVNKESDDTENVSYEEYNTTDNDDILSKKSNFKNIISSDIIFVIVFLILIIGSGLGVGLGIGLGNNNTNTASSNDGDNNIKDAVIIGAGWAGISAAKELIDNGVTDVLILEAEDYVGGRCKTYNMEDGSINEHPIEVLSETNIPLEIGAEWLYDEGDVTDYLYYETNLLDRVDVYDDMDYYAPLDHSRFYRQLEDGSTAIRLTREESDELYSSVVQKFNSFRQGLSGGSLQDALDLFLGQEEDLGVDERRYLDLVLDAAYSKFCICMTSIITRFVHLICF